MKKLWFIIIILFFDLTISLAQSMVVDSVHVTSFTYDCFPNNTTYKFILRINIVTSNFSNPLTLDTFNFNTSGSTDAATDIKNARVFSTGVIDAFSKDILVGINPNPTGNFLISGPHLLKTGNNYFWLTYDITDAATPGNTIQAILDSVTISTLNYIPTSLSLAFNRSIDARSNYPHKEANIWYTDRNLGIDFNCTTPVIIDDHSDYFQSIEGTGAICDRFGNLLFYTDAVRVFNRVHEITPNGSGMLSSSSKHSGLFVKKPCDSTTYYLISPGYSTSDKLYWNEIDLTLDGGFGDIVPGKKNLILMNDNLDEMLACVNHCNEQDVWVLSGKNGTNEFHAFLVSDAGLSTIPVISTPIGGPINITTGRGSIKFSPNGKWLILTAQISTSTIRTTLYQFDNSTGLVSNPLTLNSADAHSPSFSPDNTKLYIGQEGSQSIFQYDLNVLNIVASRTFVGTAPSGGALWLLQNAPDGKIYMEPGGNSTTYPVINNPNLIAPLCNFDPTGFSLNGSIHSSSLSFISSYNESFFNLSPNALDTLSLWFSVSFSPMCNGVFPVQFTDASESLCGQGYTYNWDFGDGNSSALQNPSHSYSATGSYMVALTLSSGCSFDTTLSKQLNITTAGTITTTVFDDICEGDSILLGGNYQTTTGIYYDTLVASSGCDSILITNLLVNPSDSILVYSTICEGDSILLGGNYQTTTGIYYDVLVTGSGCDSILITNLLVNPSDSILVYSTICEGDSILLGGNYQTTTGIYYDVLVTGSGCDSILSTVLTISSLNSIQVTKDTSIMIGESINLLASGASFYLWSTGDTGNIINVYPMQTTTYFVTGTNSQGCESIGIVTVTVILQYDVYVPNAFSPSSSNLEHNRLYVYGRNIELYEFAIFDRWGELVFETDDISATLRQDGLCCAYGEGWDGTHMNAGEPLNPAVFAYKLNVTYSNGDEFLESGNITLIK